MSHYEVSITWEGNRIDIAQLENEYAARLLCFEVIPSLKPVYVRCTCEDVLV